MKYALKTKQAIAIVAALILAAVAAGWYLAPQLPDVIATHWNATGQVNGTMAKIWALVFVPLLAAGTATVLFFVPTIDPLKESYKAFRREYNWLIVLIVAFLVMIQGLVLAWNLGYRFNFSRFIAPSIGLLFYFIGGILPGLKRNWFAGIRTPWTLSSDRVWKKTHEHAGSVFQLAGIVACFGAVLPDYALYFLILPLLTAIAWVIAYSYVIYRKGE